MLLFILILLISEITSEELKHNKIEENGVKYAGPIVYSNEPPPVVYFPTPPTPDSNKREINESNVGLSNHVEYIPFPYQDLPVLIYKSRENPPIHLVPENTPNNNSNDSKNHFDKRFGDIANSGAQRASRALKSWSQFKLFNDMPLVMKAPKWTASDSSGGNFLSGQIIDMNNSSMLNSAHNHISLANAPHLVYSGHPPIHVFPQPIIIKESLSGSEMGEMTSASEPLHVTALKNLKSHNNIDLSLGASNKHEISTNPAQASVYSYSSAPSGSNSGKSYGYRVKTRDNKYDPDYSSSQNYDNYDDQYSQPQPSQHSDSSSDSQTDDNIGQYARPSANYGNSISMGSLESNNENYDKEYERDPRIRYSNTYSNEKLQEKYPKYNFQNWGDLDQENGWLSSLLGYTRWPSRHRRPGVGHTAENLLYAASHPTNHIDMETLALMNPHLRNNGWLTGFGGLRPAATAIRPVYSLSSLLGYRRPPIPPPSPYFGRFGPGLAHAGSSLSPVAMKSYGFGPTMMGLPSLTYPMRVPYSPYLMYGYRRPPFGYGNMHSTSGDLAFAESNRKANTSKNNQNKASNNKEDLLTSASHVKPTFVLPPLKQTTSSHHNKPPIIIYQGLRPPVHLYQQTEAKSKSTNDNEKMETHQMKNQIQDQSITTTTTTTTENPYYHFYSTEDSKEETLDKRYKPGLARYSSLGTAFSPRLSSNDEWTPLKQTAPEPNQNKSDSDYQT